MHIRKLSVDNFRNLQQVQLELHPKLNFFFGDNGAGKTSLLESLIVLAKGRSFRSGQTKDLIGPEQDWLRVFVVLEQMNGSEHKLAIQRSVQDWQGRFDGYDIKQLSELSPHLPLVLMEPTSHRLVDGPPESRRRYLDWGVFHVKHDYLNDWRRYQRALKQRNAALRGGQKNLSALLDSIDPMLVSLGEAITQSRQVHVSALSEQVKGLLEDLSDQLESVELKYYQGWASGESFEQMLAQSRARDIEQGATGPGPQRADLRIQFGGDQAKHRLSRGQQKIVAAALLLSQAQLLVTAGEKPVLLLDDLASEFDHHHLQHMLAVAQDMDVQVWVTGTQDSITSTVSAANKKVFHVKRGTVQEMV